MYRVVCSVKMVAISNLKGQVTKSKESRDRLRTSDHIIVTNGCYTKPRYMNVSYTNVCQQHDHRLIRKFVACIWVTRVLVTRTSATQMSRILMTRTLSTNIYYSSVSGTNATTVSHPNVKFNYTNIDAQLFQLTPFSFVTTLTNFWISIDKPVHVFVAPYDTQNSLT